MCPDAFIDEDLHGYSEKVHVHRVSRVCVCVCVYIYCHVFMSQHITWPKTLLPVVGHMFYALYALEVCVVAVWGCCIMYQTWYLHVYHQNRQCGL